MKKHFAKMLEEDESPEYLEKTWADVHRIFLGLGAHLRGLDAWLVQQFTGYLEVIGMNDFSGFKKEFFDYYFVHDNEDARKWVKHIMAVFAHAVLDELGKSIPFYQYVDLGRIKLSDTSCWAAFGNSKEKYRNLAHQTITADSQGLNIFVNVELKPAVEKLRYKIKNNHSEWRRIVSRLHTQFAYSLKIQERVQMQAQKYDYRPVCVVESAYLDDPKSADLSFNFLESLIGKIPLPYITLGTQVDRQEVIKVSERNQGKAVIQKTMSLMAALHPVVEFINGS